MFYFLLFIEGFIGLAYQLLFLRQIEPQVGSSSVTTGWIIGLFLLALSIGYREGGKAKLTPYHTLGVNLLKSAAVAGIGMSAAVLDLYFGIMMPVLGRLGSLALYATVVVGPVAYWMGQSLPLLIQRSSWGNQASDKGGNALFLSTLGSFAGAIATPNLLFFMIGATNTLLFTTVIAFGVGVMLCAPMKIWQEPERHYNVKTFVLTGLFVVLGWGVNGTRWLDIPHASTAYADMFVLKDESSRYLWSNKLLMSVSSRDTPENQAWYLGETARLMDYHKVDDADILVLGAGGFMLHTTDQRENRYHYIDIDPAIKPFVTAHFNPSAADQRFTAQDARAHLIESDTKQDVIYLDTFSSRHALPRHLLTQEFFALLSTRLKPDGLLLINAILDPAFNDPYSRNFHYTLLSVFPYCMSSAGYPGGAAANVIYHCRNRQEIRTIYTDQKNTAEYDSVDVMGR